MSPYREPSPPELDRDPAPVTRTVGYDGPENAGAMLIGLAVGLVVWFVLQVTFP